MLTRLDWWLGVALIAGALVLHAAVPRYEWRSVPEEKYRLIRIDRWTGDAQIGLVTPGMGRWVSSDTRGRAVVSQAATATPTKRTPQDVNLPFVAPLQRPDDCSPKAQAADPRREMECFFTDPAGTAKGCTPEAIAKSRDPLRGVLCTLAEPLTPPK